MVVPPSKSPLKHLRASDLLAVAQLATHATMGVTQIVEGVHLSVWSTLGIPGGPAPGQTGGLTGLVYRSITGTTRLVGRGTELALAGLQPVLEATVANKPGTPEREAVLAALNGVMGDWLEKSGSSLATPTTLRWNGAPLELDQALRIEGAKRKIVLLIHGLCMNDLQWRCEHEGQVVDHGRTVSDALVATPLYLRYNTGLNISSNGHLLADQLELLLAHWPKPLEQMSVIAHSMGGLLIRSALNSAQSRGLRWPGVLQHIVFLGTPHHGAPLERAGNWVDLLLGGTPWSAPFTRLTQLRSAGITDLRYGFVSDSDWQGKQRFRRAPDQRLPLPLPEQVACYTIAATLAGQRSLLADRLVGDGLVPLHSALGQHDHTQRTLRFEKAAQRVLYRTNHMQLLSSPEVGQQLLDWLKPSTASATGRS